MPLDPQIQAAIEQARAAGARRPEQSTPAEARAVYRERYRARGVAPGGAVDVSRLVISTPEGGIPARLYRPGAAAANDALPLVVYFHGGGFVLGDADAYESQSAFLAERGRCMVLFAEFRLAPEFPFPAAVNDAIATVRWVIAHAASLRADPLRLAVMGDSAGGNLAVNASIALRDSGHSPLRLQCLMYPALDYRYLLPGGPSYESARCYSDGYWLDRSTREYFFSQYFSHPADAEDPRASPLAAGDLSRLPPTLVMTAEYDPLRDIGRAFYERLIAAGNAADYRCVTGVVHNFMGHAGISQAAARAVENIADVLRARLHRGD